MSLELSHKTGRREPKDDLAHDIQKCLPGPRHVVRQDPVQVGDPVSNHPRQDLERADVGSGRRLELRPQIPGPGLGLFKQLPS